MGRKIADFAGLQVFDRGIVASAEQRDPVSLCADMHPALVIADLNAGLVCGRAFRRRSDVEVGRMLAITIHALGPTPLKSAGRKMRGKLEESVNPICSGACRVDRPRRRC